MTEPADRPVPILINRAGGTASAAGARLADNVQAACREAGLAAEIALLDGTEIVAAVTAQAGRRRIVVGGGDGTLGAAAGALVRAGSTATLGILPLGTRNHLAHDLGIPDDLAGAVRIIAEDRVQRIDVGIVNGCAFVNNASIGLYPLLVRSREQERERHGLPKWLANIVAARAVLRRMRHHRLAVEIDGTTRSIRTPLLFVGNNVYSLAGGHVGTRDALTDGRLSLVAVASSTRLVAMWLALRTLAGRADPERDFAALETSRAFTVSAHARDIHIALDGELRRLHTPLRFEIAPLALRVAVPAPIPTETAA